MPAIWMEPGTDATQDTSFYSTVTAGAGGGAVGSASDQFYTGGRSLKLTAGTTSPTTVVRSGILADTGRRISVRVRFSADAATGTSFLRVRAAGGNIITVQRLSNNKLRLNLPSGAGANGTSTIASNAWYRITLAYTITSTTVFEFRLYVDGVLEATLTTGTLSFTSSVDLQLEAPEVLLSNGAVWFDDIYVDDGADYLDPGNIAVTAKRPNANSTNTFDTTTSTTNSGYGTGNSIYVNERPLATTGARRMNGSGGTRLETFAIENAATGDVNLTGATLVARLAWVHGSGVSTDTIYDNNSAAVPSAAGGGAFTTTAGIRFKVSDSASYPANPATGMGRPTGNATDAILNECGVMIAYLTTIPWIPIAIFSDGS